MNRVSRYRIEKRLGAGGMGEVFRAFDEELGRPVALKQIHPKAAESSRARARFLREAKAAARLNHPNLVQIYDILEDGDGLWIVMELAQGDVLKTRLLQHGPLAAQEALRLAVEISRGLAAAHGVGILHRDLKTENVVLDGGQVKILDFGLAKPLWSTGEDDTLTATGQLLGTPRSMSPEQALAKKVDPRSDLFSLGSLLYEVTTGISPFLGANHRETLDRVCNHHPPPAHEIEPRVPEGFSHLIDLLLKKDPSRRPQTAVALVPFLERMADSPETALAPGELTQIAQITQIDPDTAPKAGERRQVTVLCCDLMALGAGGLDAQTLAQASPEFQALAGEALESFQGHLGDFQGHRLVAYFGYPRAHEDDAKRAVHTGLQVVNQIADLNRRLAERGTAPLAVRVGIHTGPAVVLGRASEEQQLVLGQTLDLATGLQTRAQPNQIVVSAATRTLLGSVFDSEDLPPTRLPGFPGPVIACSVSEAKDPSSRWETTEALTPLVAREPELELLADCWQRAKGGKGQVVLLAGEAGIGKSRLVRSLEERLAPEEPAWLLAQGSTYAQNSPLYPIVELLRRSLKLDPDESPPERLQALEDELRRYAFPLDEVMPLLAPLFSLPLEARYSPLGLSPQAQRRKTLEALGSLLVEMARRRPLVLLVEDLHWMDPSTLELLGLLMDQLNAAPLLLLLTFRLHFEPPWERHPNWTQLNLHRLNGLEVETLIQKVTGSKSIPAEVKQQIIDKTDGVPLFVEELTKTVLESELLIEVDDGYELAEPLRPFEIPTTLRDSLTARLDRLGTAKEVAQLAAVVGREFSHRLLAAISPLDDAALKHALDGLVRAELIHRKGFSSRRRYLFKHALIQDAAYDSLLARQRRTHHTKIATVLEEQFSDTVKTQPELLAHHYTEADLKEPAVRYWQRAADSGLQRSASQEAIAHANRGLELLEDRPEKTEWAEKELGLRVALGAGLVSARGFAAPEVEVAFGRAREICERLDPGPQLYRILADLQRFYTVGGKFYKALEIGQEMLRFADSDHEVEARQILGAQHWYLGDFAQSRDYLDQAEQLVVQRKGILRHNVGALAPKVKLLLCQGLVSWHLGYAEKARLRMQEAVSLARGGDPLTLGHGLAQAVWFYFMCRNVELLRLHSKELIALCQEKGLFFGGVTTVFLGWCHIVRHRDQTGADLDTEDAEEWLPRMIQGLKQYRATGARLIETLALSQLADACACRGQFPQAQAYLDEALAAAESTGERFWKADLHRQRGELELATSPPADLAQLEAQRWFEQALGIARQQGAKLLELRAAVGLSRLWREQGSLDKARHLLTPLVNGFTEGFDTWDLQEANTLLDSLSSTTGVSDF